MNDLSWLIYTADMVGSVNGFLATVIVLGLMLSVVLGFFLLVTLSGPVIFSWDDKETKIANHKKARDIASKGLKIVPTVAVAAWLISIPIPSQNTIYAIAASEMGERAIATPTAEKAIKAIDAWLDKQIGENAK